MYEIYRMYAISGEYEFIGECSDKNKAVQFADTQKRGNGGHYVVAHESGHIVYDN